MGLPGVGPQVAAAVLALLPPHLWGRAKAAAAYAGLIPEREESGKSLERSQLSRKGPPLLRRKLFMGGLVAVRHDPEMGAFYHRLLSRGKRNEQALVAVAHKLRFGAPTPNEPWADDGEAKGVLRGPVPPGGGLTGKTVSKSLHDP
jgi:transposase